MAIWDRLLKKLISPLVDESIKKSNKEKKVEKGLTAQATSSLGLYPLGIGKVERKRFPKGIRFSTLREFSLYYPILRACINYRKRQITQLAWDVAPKDVVTDKKKREKYKDDAKIIKDFLKYPVGDKTISFRGFVSKLIEDLLILDAIAVYKRLNRGGGIFGYLPIDATTIELLLNENDGTTPLPPKKAYVQKIKGKVTAKLSTDELIYRMMNPRTETPYGLSPVEVLIINITTALKLSAYNLAFLSEGNVPEGLVELPEDIASSPDQLKQWQEAWDTMISGDPRYQRKIKFLPPGMKWHPIRKSEDMTFERFEKWLLLNTCSVMEVPPQAIGFQFERGKGATEAEWEIGKERGLFPMAHFLKEIFDEIIQTDLGEDHLQFVWTNINPTNKLEEAKVFDVLVNSGAVSIDEWRLGEGLDPIGMPHYISTPTGPIFTKDLVESSEQGTPILPQSYLPSGKKPTPPVKETPNISQKGFPQKIEKMAREDIVKELKRWKKVASKDAKLDRPFREFRTTIIDSRTKRLIKEGLESVKIKKDLDQLFDPFISQENQMIAAMLDLYDEVSKITGHEQETTTKNPKSN